MPELPTNQLITPATGSEVPNNVTIEPKNGAPAPAEESPDQAGALPPELMQIPVFQGLIAGQPPAVSLTIDDFEKRPEAELAIKNKDALMQAGFGFYRSLQGGQGVIFNQLYIHPEDIKQADKAGKLQEVAPPFDVVNSAISGAGAANPILTHKGPPGALPQPTGAAPPQFNAPMMVPPPSRSQTKLAADRGKQAGAGSPTSGPAPGRGRLLNELLKPVV